LQRLGTAVVTRRLRILHGEDIVGDAKAPSAPGGIKGRKETLLIADDDASLRRVMMRALSRFGYGVLPVTNGEEALAALRAHPGAIDLVISDVSMPRKTGLELYREVRSHDAGMKFLFTSGYEMPEHEKSGDPNLRTLQKPWTLEEMTQAVRDLLDA
jgi:two-component system cell cycle sensor histidine kinase/response regulator CckA